MQLERLVLSVTLIASMFTTSTTNDPSGMKLLARKLKTIIQSLQLPGDRMDQKSV